MSGTSADTRRRTSHGRVKRTNSGTSSRGTHDADNNKDDKETDRKPKSKKSKSKSKKSSLDDVPAKNDKDRKLIKSLSKRSVASAPSKGSDCSASTLWRMKDLQNRHQSLQNMADTVKDKQSASSPCLANKLSRSKSNDLDRPGTNHSVGKRNNKSFQSSRKSKSTGNEDGPRSHSRWLVSTSIRRTIVADTNTDDNDNSSRGQDLDKRLQALQEKWKNATSRASLLVVDKDLSPCSIKQKHWRRQLAS